MKTEIIKRKRVLVVEDDAVFRAWVKQVLEKRGYTVAQSNNGAEAMRLFSNHDYDLIVADYRLPFMTGDELAQRIKSIAPEQAVLLVTGHPSFRCTDKSVDAVLYKPFEADDLGRAIERILLKAEAASAC